MRSARAFLASLGAGTCLIVAGTLAMVSLSTVVAFSGLPGMRIGKLSTPTAQLASTPKDDATMRSTRQEAIATLRRPGRPASASASSPARSEAARPSAALRTPPSTAPSRGGRTLLPPTATPAVPAPSGPVPTRPPIPARAPTTPTAPSPVPAVPAPPQLTFGGPVQRLGEAADGAVTGATKGLGDAIVPVAPPVGGAVTETGEVVGAAIPATIEVLRGLLGGLAGGG